MAGRGLKDRRTLSKFTYIFQILSLETDIAPTDPSRTGAAK